VGNGIGEVGGGDARERTAPTGPEGAGQTWARRPRLIGGPAVVRVEERDPDLAESGCRPAWTTRSPRWRPARPWARAASYSPPVGATRAAVGAVLSATVSTAAEEWPARTVRSPPRRSARRSPPPAREVSCTRCQSAPGITMPSRRHWYARAPEATTVKVALCPSGTVWLAGGEVTAMLHASGASPEAAPPGAGRLGQPVHEGRDHVDARGRATRAGGVSDRVRGSSPKRVRASTGTRVVTPVASARSSTTGTLLAELRAPPGAGLRSRRGGPCR
jgi:hypothetical protein